MLPLSARTCYAGTTGDRHSVTGVDRLGPAGLRVVEHAETEHVELIRSLYADHGGATRSKATSPFGAEIACRSQSRRDMAPEGVLVAGHQSGASRCLSEATAAHLPRGCTRSSRDR
ncbi:hypothetical protein AB0J28_32000 [Streptosporangium canum]|uniref:hypothetical protein n=1 Tax=Streptosporangium canum TaxID=324952 RepID=UPI00344AB328